jgi:predicted MFS family arabinose efflux permease
VTTTGNDNRLTSPVWAAIYLGIAAATLPAVMPVMIGILADELAFGNAGAGYVASANLAGVGVGSIVCLALARRWSWTVLIIAGALIMIGTNFLTTLYSSYQYILFMRLASGLGEGLIAAICYAAMGHSREPARALSFYVAGQGLVGAIGMGIMPTIVEQSGWQWFFVLVSVLALPAFVLARLIGTLQEKGMDGRVGRRGAVSWNAAYTLGSILMYFIGMAAIWAFLERMGDAKGLDTMHLSMSLSASAIANMVGSLAVGIVAHRLSTVGGLVVGMAALVASLVGLVAFDAWEAFLVSAVLFSFSWGFYFPYQFRLLARVDHEVTGVMPAITGGGLTIGPAVGGFLLSTSGTASVCVFGLSAVVVSVGTTFHINLRSKRLENSYDMAR